MLFDFEVFNFHYYYDLSYSEEKQILVNLD